MSRKGAVAVVLAAAFSIALPLSGMASQTAHAATRGAKSTSAKAKSRQAIAARQTSKRTSKRPMKKTTSRRPATKKQTENRPPS